MRIRPAAPADAPVLAELHAAAGFERPWSAGEIAALAGAPGALCLAAEDDAGLAGFVLARAVADEAEILTLAVAPDRRRRGAGRALVAAAVRAAEDRGSAGLFLEVAEDNAAALALYAACGFRTAGRRKSYYPRAGAAAVDALVMKRALNTEARRTYFPDSMDRIEQLCAQRGLRMTDQRRVVARVLSQSQDHPDVEELYRRASAVDPNISIATVYRTVRLFEEAGVVEKHDFGDGRSRYEEAGEEHHDHLIDTRTGMVVEFFDEEIERMKTAIAERLGYRLIGHKLELYGVPLDEAAEG